MRNRFASILVSALAVVAALVALEVGLRIARYGASFTPLTGMMEPDPLLGWHHRPNVNVRLEERDFRISVQYNSQGLRGPVRALAKPAGVTRILVLGDSFADGYTVELPQRFTEVLQKDLGPRFEVINLGVAGFSTDQELLQFQRDGLSFQPDIVVLAFYYNDVWGNGSRALAGGNEAPKPLYVLDPDGGLHLTNVPVSPPRPQQPASAWRNLRTFQLVRTAIYGNPRLHSLAVRFHLAQARTSDDAPPDGGLGTASEFSVFRRGDSAEIAADWTLTSALLKRMRDLAVQHNARFLLFYVPTRDEVSTLAWGEAHLDSSFDPGVVTAHIAAMCGTVDLDCLDPTAQYRQANRLAPLYLPHDPHWTVAGHALAATLLANRIRSMPAPAAGATAR